MLRSVVILILSTAVLAASASAAPHTVPSARRHFLKGMHLYDQGRYQDAIDEFEASYRDNPHGVIRYNIAECYQKLGNLDGALENYREYLKQVPAADDRAKVESFVTGLEARIADRKQPLDLSSDPPGATIEIDGVVRGQAPLLVPLTKGLHHVSAELLGRQSVVRDVDMPADAPVKLALQLPAKPPPVPAPSLSPSAAPVSTAVIAPPPPPGKKRVFTAITAGVAGASIVGAVGFGIGAVYASNELVDTPHPTAKATPLFQTANNDMRTSNVLSAVAGVAIAASVALFFVEGRF